MIPVSSGQAIFCAGYAIRWLFLRPPWGALATRQRQGYVDFSKAAGCSWIILSRWASRPN